MKINIHKTELLATVAQKKDYPKSVIPEIALVGRSNVGKSSMINRVLNRKSLARVSATPGKTATINFYSIDNKLMLVDLPGYGYAARSKEEKKKWAAMINEYLSSRAQLSQLILLVDSRHKPSADDVIMMNWIRQTSDYAVVFATKTDKLGKKQLSENLELIIETLQLEDGDVLIPFSANNAESAENFWDYIYGCVLSEEE